SASLTDARRLQEAEGQRPCPAPRLLLRGVGAPLSASLTRAVVAMPRSAVSSDPIEVMPMRIGILGSGLMGGKLGTIFARAGHEVVFSYARSERKLKRLAREAGGNARVGTPRDAARDADAVLLAIHWSRLQDVLRQAGDLAGKVVVTCSLPMSTND